MTNIIHVLHSSLKPIHLQFRDSICKECEWSMAKFYKRLNSPEKVKDMEASVIIEECNRILLKLISENKQWEGVEFIPNIKPKEGNEYYPIELYMGVLNLVKNYINELGNLLDKSVAQVYRVKSRGQDKPLSYYERKMGIHAFIQVVSRLLDQCERARLSLPERYRYGRMNPSTSK